MYEFDARLVYTDLAAAQQLFGMPQRVSGIELRVADPAHIEALMPAIRQAVGRYPYRVNDWKELNVGLFSALALQKVVMFLVLCCMVVVASFNIAATLFMAVVEKNHDIAVLKSMGARDASIMKIFVLQGLMVGASGTALGLLLGCMAALALDQLHIGIAADVYMVDALRVRLQAADVGLVAAAALCISHLSTLFPALQAASRPPAAALRLS
jgi:lipoprotein-releasing system permease protein